MASNDGKGDELTFGKGDKSKVRGLRASRSLTVETYSAEDLEETVDTVPVATSKSCTVVGLTHEDQSRINFVSGNPFVEVTKGILHLYKENEPTATDKPDVRRSEMLCMLAVPAGITCRDLLQFVAPFQADMEHVKVIRDPTPNQYMVLIKFKSYKGADLFYQTFNGTTFNSIEDDVCHLAYVSRVETKKEEDGGGLSLVGHTELPTCPVCLERMDESVDGILTILCNHSFHSNCLSKWSDSSCPVCRYVQTPELVASNQCFECHSSDSLWICLICGHIGCGRYVQGHAYKHFIETQHCYAIQPDNNRVWDYVGDNFVHRLLQNKGDGKLVEVTGGAHRSVDSCEEADDKLDSIQLEFTYMLTTQLESQRSFFEEKLAIMQKEMRKEMDSFQMKLEDGLDDKQNLELKIATMQKERANLERKINTLSQKLTRTTAELKEERELNKCLQKDQVHWQEMVAKLEKQYEETVKEKMAEISDLKEQLRDIMFFLDAQNKIEESPMKSEIVDGHVIVDQTSQQQSASSSRTGRKKKR